MVQLLGELTDIHHTLQVVVQEQMQNWDGRLSIDGCYCCDNTGSALFYYGDIFLVPFLFRRKMLLIFWLGFMINAIFSLCRAQVRARQCANLGRAQKPCEKIGAELSAEDGVWEVVGYREKVLGAGCCHLRICPRFADLREAVRLLRSGLRSVMFGRLLGSWSATRGFVYGEWCLLCGLLSLFLYLSCRKTTQKSTEKLS